MSVGVPRTVKSAEYIKAAERNDGAQDWLVGDVTYVRFNECKHIKYGSPIAHYKPGSRDYCRQCAINEQH